MNIPYDITEDIHIPTPVTKPVTQVENCMREHPGGTLLLVAGIGIATVLIARALTPAPPRNRALRLLEDIQQHLATLSEEGSKAVSKGMDTLGAAHLDHKFNKLSRKFKQLFQ